MMSNETSVEKAKKSKSFCILPWIHQYIDPSGAVRPCCVFNNSLQLGNFKESSLQDIWNNDASKKIRIDMLNDVEIPGCDICSFKRNLTVTIREKFNKRYFNESTYNIVNNTKEDGSLEKHELLYIDARFNNLCNFKCRTCDPGLSTSWAEDTLKIYEINNEKNLAPKVGLLFPGIKQDSLLKEILPHLVTIRQIYFAGGESLIQEEHYRVMEEILRLKREDKILLFYNTNFSKFTLGQYNVLDFWKQFPRVTIHASIDGSHDQIEYWRKGANWKQIENNRILLKQECPHVTFKVNYTLSWVNAFNLPKFHKEWVTKGLLEINNILINPVIEPKWASMKYVPKWKKNQISDVLCGHIEWLQANGAAQTTIDEFKNALTVMNDSTTEYDCVTIMKQILLVDRIRNENFWDVFPEHLDMKVDNV